MSTSSVPLPVAALRRRRFVPPPRAVLDAAALDHPIFAALHRHADWLHAPYWPSIASLDAKLGDARHPRSGERLRFVEQTPELLADGLHYEERIHRRGEIATRRDNWHDLFNAMIWIEQCALKAALNARQVSDIERAGARERTRAQCALTHFDEAGAIVRLRSPRLLEAWDAHDWETLLWDAAEAWRSGEADVIVFGHALFEHALQPSPLHSAKCLAILDESRASDASATDIDALADAIARGELLNDPQELRPLPLSGLPGWHPRSGERSFYREAPCFRPLRAGRVYPQAFAPPPPNRRA
jgi:hypothetical protein